MGNKTDPQNRIRNVRDKKGISQQKLADLCNTTSQQIRHLESGRRNLTVDWLTRLSQALDCHPWSLVEAQGDFLSEEDKALLVKIRSLSPDAQENVERFVDFQAAEEGGD